MNVSAWSIKNPIPSIILFFMLSFAGFISFSSMKIQNFPDLDLPTVTISAALPGASPTQLESEVARKIENSLTTLQGLKHTYTKIQDGVVSITAEFNLEKPTQEAVDDVRSAISQIRADLPTDLRDPVIGKLNVAGSPMLAFTIHSEQMDDEALSWYVDDALSKRLLNIKGVGTVKRVGGVNRQIWIELDTAKLQSLNATAGDISRQLRNIQMETAGGSTKLGGNEQPIRTIATVKSADELAQVQIVMGNGEKVRLDQIAHVIDTVAEPTSLAMLNGKNVVGFEITRSKGASEVEVGTDVRKALKDLALSRPDIKITEAFDFVTPVQQEFDASMTLLYEGAILAVLVVWLFLRDLRATFISAVAIPLSVIPTFIGMQYFGFTINVVTLLALSLVIGVLVDDAIVEVENIVRHLRMGKTPYQAAMEAADEIGLAVVATTFTLIAVFLPTAFMSGIPGKFFKQFGWTAAIAVFASLLVARALTPMMAAYLMKPISDKTHQDGFVMRKYMKASRWCIEHRLITSVAAGLFFIGSLMLIPLLPKGFIPADDSSQTQVRLELAPGATLSQTREISEMARKMVSKVAHVTSVYTTIGGGAAGTDPFIGSGVAETRKATLTILLDARGSRPKKQIIEADIRTAIQNLPGARATVGLGGSGEKYILVLSGEDAQALQVAAAAVEKDLRTIKGLGNISSSASLVRSEIVARPDFAAAADLGVTTASIADTLRIATVGDYDQLLTKLNLSQRQVPIVVKVNTSARKDLTELERLSVPGARGPVMLSQVAKLEIAGGPAQIDRYDRAKTVQFNIELAKRALGDVTAEVAKLPSIKNLPAGVSQKEQGDAEVMAELFASFGLAMLTGVLCIFFVLVLLFKDFLQPVTILAALPLSIGGAFLGLLVADKSLSMPSMIGLVMLMGIATKNSILLVEYAIVARRDHGMTRVEAIMDACHKRARPIVMTTIAMSAGMLPIAMAWGSGDVSFRSPMAAAVIGGLLTSTLLSLLVIPVVFTYVDDFSQFCERMWHKFSHTKPS